MLLSLGLFLAGSWSGWSREAVERDLSGRAEALAAAVEVKEGGELELEDEGLAAIPPTPSTSSARTGSPRRAATSRGPSPPRRSQS